jgi:hypothetical protein
MSVFFCVVDKNKKIYKSIQKHHENYNLSFLSFFNRLKREEGGGILVQMSQTQVQSQQQSSGSLSDHDEKKMRRQIANSNERRRMQSINAGFQSLRQLLPHHEGEKLSKVSHKSFLTK